MAQVIKTWKGTFAFDKNVTLTQYRYEDGSTNHWLLRDRLGHPYNPIDQDEVDKIIRNWKLAEV